MPKIRPAGYASLAFHHTGGDVTGEMVNTMDVDFNSLGLPFDQAYLDDLSDLWANGPHSRHSSPILYTKVTALVHGVDGEVVSLESTHGSITGSGEPDILPLSVAAIVQKTTALAGRSFRGRWFFGGIGLNAAKTGNANTLDPAWLTPFQTACSQWLADMTLAKAVPVLLHEGAHPPTIITRLDCHTLVGTMRKRIR